MSRNRHGLARDIPAEVKRTVRRECEFGCVICGNLPYQYEHFAPEFADARNHCAEGIALLCANCHQDRTSGRLSSDRVSTARRLPFNRGKDTVWRARLAPRELVLRIGSNRISGRSIGLSVNGSVVFGARAPLSNEVDWFLTGSFVDATGEQVLRFEDNTITAVSGLWDVELSGELLTVRQGPGAIVAQVRIDAMAGELAVERLEMRLDGDSRLSVADGVLCVSGSGLYREISGNTFSGSGSAIHIGSSMPSTGSFSTIAVNDPQFGTFESWIRRSEQPGASVTGQTGNTGNTSGMKRRGGSVV